MRGYKDVQRKGLHSVAEEGCSLRNEINPVAIGDIQRVGTSHGLEIRMGCSTRILDCLLYVVQKRSTVLHGRTNIHLKVSEACVIPSTQCRA